MTNQEYSILMQDINAALRKYHPMNPVTLGLLFSTCGICFCPLIYSGYKLSPRVRGVIETSSVGKVLINERGVAIDYYCGNRKLNILGGLIFRLPAQPPQALAAPVGQVMYGG